DRRAAAQRKRVERAERGRAQEIGDQSVERDARDVDSRRVLHDVDRRGGEGGQRVEEHGPAAAGNASAGPVCGVAPVSARRADVGDPCAVGLSTRDRRNRNKSGGNQNSSGRTGAHSFLLQTIRNTQGGSSCWRISDTTLVGQEIR